MSNDIAHRKPLFRLALFLVCAILIFLALNTLYSFTSTLSRLDVVESQRDQWQRPSDVLRALYLQPGNTVVDLGSGAGYFALKLSPAVGKRGQVLAVDLRKLSLFFLWTRALLRSPHNIHVIVGEEDDPRLPAGGVDAVLICNTYHEFNNPELILNRVFRSLRPGGRLVVVDRTARAIEAQPTHEVLSGTVVETELSTIEDSRSSAMTRISLTGPGSTYGGLTTCAEALAAHQRNGATGSRIIRVATRYMRITIAHSKGKQQMMQIVDRCFDDAFRWRCVPGLLTIHRSAKGVARPSDEVLADREDGVHQESN